MLKVREKRILLVLTAFDSTGGIQRFNRNVLKALSILKYESVDVISLNDANHVSNLTSAQKKQSDNTNVDMTGFNRILRCDRSKLKFVTQVVELLLVNRYDIVVWGHINLLPLLLLVRFLNKSAKNVAFFHGIEVWGQIDRVKAFLINKLDLCLPVSTYTQQSIQDQIKKLVPILRVFPNTLPVDWAIEDHNLIPFIYRDNDLLCVTRLDITEREKGVVHILHSMKDERLSNTKLIVVGDGNDRENLENEARRLLLDERVSFVKEISDQQMKNLYRNSKVFVLPSKKEGFGIVYLEAMAYETPVVACNEKGVRDVVINEKTGLTIDYGDVENLASVLDKILKCKIDIGSITRSAKSLVSTGGVFTFERFTERLKLALEI